LPAQVQASGQVAAYAVTRDDGVIVVTLINRDATNEARMRIDLSSTKAVKKARVLRLEAKGNDIAAGSRDITLNDASIDDRGRWNGKWMTVEKPALAGKAVSVTLAPASAAVVEISTAAQGR
jgi:alpha-L-arabinofuranosidase